MDKMHACPSHNHNNHCNDLIPPADQTFRPPDSALRLYQLISIAFNFQGFLSKIHILPCKRDNDFISCICGNHRLQKSLSDCLLLSLTQPSSESRIVSDADVRELARRPNCQTVEILQAYLKSEIPGETIRIRQRGKNGNYVYFKTRKQVTESGKRIEKEERLTQNEYLELLMQADPDYRPIRKQRFCLSENGLYYNIDIYPQWKDTALMEIELYSGEDEVRFPEGIRVIREVTG